MSVVYLSSFYKKYIFKQKGRQADRDRQGQTGADRGRQGQTGTDRDRQVQTGTDKERQGQTANRHIEMERQKTEMERQETVMKDIQRWRGIQNETREH
jgi:hypothetical protein